MRIKACHVVMCLSLWGIIGLSGPASALLQTAPDTTDASETISSTLIIYCGTSDEFDPDPTPVASDPEARNTPSLPADRQHTATLVAIPEASTLVLLGLGLLGMLRFMGTPKK
jgi:hypothetical protein